MDTHSGPGDRKPRAAASNPRAGVLPLLPILLCVGFLACRQAAVRNEPRAAAPVTPTIEALSPKGNTRWPFSFEWKATGATAAVYRVTVFDLVERPLVEQDTRETRLDAPHDLEVLLPRTRRFLWRVTLLDSNGEPVLATPLIRFTVQ